MMDFGKMLESLLPVLGEWGVKKLEGELVGIGAESSESWQKAILSLLSEGVAAYGLQGLHMAVEAITNLLDGGDEVPEWADLATGSDILAHFQNAEAGRKSAAKDFMTKVGHVLGDVLGGFIKGLLS